MSYKTELHCHTQEFSGCSHVSAEDTAEKYIAAGYSTLVITNHFRKNKRKGRTHAETTHEMFEAAEKVRAAAGDRLCVLTSMEVSLECMPNDFLVIGPTEEQTAAMDDMFDLSPGQLRERVSALGGLLIQAHPFRFGQTVVNPAEVDGIEVFNGHTGHHSHNDIAKLWALLYSEHYRRDGGFILTSGTDHHDPHHIPNGGIETEEPITSMEQLVSVLKSGKYKRLMCSLGESDY